MARKVDWALHDDLIRTHLPHQTVESFTSQFLPHISSKAVGARARKLGIKPAKYHPTEEHKQKIAKTESKITPELAEQIKALRDDFTLKQIAQKLGVSCKTVVYTNRRFGIRLSPNGIARAHAGSVAAHLGKIPWNKGGNLTEDTKLKIGAALKGDKNGQFGRGMTEEEKVRWKEAYFTNGVHKMRQWLASETGKQALFKALRSTTTKEFRERVSKKVCWLYQTGKLKIHSVGISTLLTTQKGGQFRTRSSWETRYAQHLDSDKDVIQFQYEPLFIEYEHDSSKTHYIPDFLVTYTDHVELVEVKPIFQVPYSKNQAKFRAAETFCITKGIKFVVITEENEPCLTESQGVSQ